MQLAWRTRLAARASEQDDSVPPEAGIGDDDLAILARAQTDPRAFAPLYQRYAPAILGYCRRRLPTGDLAADATSLVFTRALAALPSFRPDPSRPGSTVRAWLFTIAHNVVVDHHRRGRTHLSLDNEPTVRWLASTPHLTDDRATPDTVALHAESADRVRALLARLPERQRRIVELRLAGLSGIEIAETIGMTHGAVKSAQFRAYATLRDALTTGFPSEHDHA